MQKRWEGITITAQKQNMKPGKYIHSHFLRTVLY